MIEVRISTAHLAAFNNEVHVGMHVLARLRDANIPIEGALFPIGVESGVLSVEREEDLAGSDDYQVWKWRP